jgi:hypothetical protein
MNKFAARQIFSRNCPWMDLNDSKAMMAMSMVMCGIFQAAAGEDRP